MRRRTSGIAFVVVTHDQEEALGLADRVAVLDHGRIQQIGSPRDIYDRPANTFVARFVGENNLIPVARGVSFETARANVGVLLRNAGAMAESTDDAAYYLQIRPERLKLDREPVADTALAAFEVARDRNRLPRLRSSRPFSRLREAGSG